MQPVPELVMAFRRVILLICLALLGVAVYLEARTPYLEALLFSNLNSGMNVALQPGPSPTTYSIPLSARGAFMDSAYQDQREVRQVFLQGLGKIEEHPLIAKSRTGFIRGTLETVATFFVAFS